MKEPDVNNSLQVRRFRARYVTAKDHPSPQNLKFQLDGQIVDSLSRHLGSYLSRWLPQDDPAIWLIRRLKLSLSINVSSDHLRIPGYWAHQIARELVATFQTGPDGQNVLCFPDQAAYLSWFLNDLASGQAWGKWYYDKFRGLRQLPVSAALRTALLDQPATGLSALLKLTADQREHLIRTLSVQDALRIIENLSAIGEGRDVPKSFHALWAAWDAVPFTDLRIGKEVKNSLRLFIAVCRNDLSLIGPALQSAAFALHRLAVLLAGKTDGQRQQLLDALAGDTIHRLYTATSVRDAEILSPLIHCAPAWVQKVGHALANRHRAESKGAADGRIKKITTPFGGIFLLLPLLDTLPLEKSVEAWPRGPVTRTVSIVRILILIKCLGQKRAQRAFRDPLIRDLMGIHPAFTVEALAEWQTNISQQALTGFLQKIYSHRCRLSLSQSQSFAMVSIPMLGAPVAVLSDMQTGTWIYARSHKNDKPALLLDHLGFWLDIIEAHQGIVHCDEIFVKPLRRARPMLSVEKLCRSPGTKGVMDHEHSSAGLIQREKFITDLIYLTFPRSFQISRSLDLALAVASQNILKNFAGRLRGFAESSLPYLYKNFLALGALLEDETDRRVVHLTKPPLNLVLSHTGMTRQSYSLHWLDERPLALFQDG